MSVACTNTFGVAINETIESKSRQVFKNNKM